ncbi:MAG: hypothetical protein JXR91_16100, partial [Deltaproteobacteria bacterium]|nr:hypothetical protein [Deltaproteobacteria bacterium]
MTRAPARITSAELDVLGFEDYHQWSNSAANSANHTQGELSVVVNASGWTEVGSTQISSLGAVKNTASIDVQVPQGPMPWGEVRIIVKIPSLGEWYKELGSQSLSGLSGGTFHTLVFDIPQDFQTKMSGTYTDLTFSVIINGPSGQYLLDNLDFGQNEINDTATAPDSSAEDTSISGSDTLIVDTSSSSDTTQQPLTVYFPMGTHPSSIVLGANEYVKINDRVNVKEYDAYITSNGIPGLNLGVDTNVGNVISRGEAFLRERSVIHGDIFSGVDLNIQNLNAYTVEGQINENVTMDPVSSITLHMGFPWPSGDNIIVSPDTTESLAPGTYNDISIYSRTQITLTAGIYRFRNVHIEPDSNIVLNDEAGPVVMLVSDSFFFRGNVTNTSNTFPQLLVGYSGTSMITFERTFRGTVLAPAAKINLEAIAIPGHEGNFYGNEIELFQDVNISHSFFTGWDELCGDILTGDCESDCPPDFVIDGGECINSKLVDCVDDAPDSAYSVIAPVEITYTDANGWSQPATCAWKCNPGACCGDNGEFKNSSTVCRVAAGDCDVEESCTGDNSECPTDSFMPSSTVCRDSAGVCDVAESCTGSGVE